MMKNEASAPGFEYEIGPVTNDKDMLSLFNTVDKKRLSRDHELAAHLQTAGWDASAGKPISNMAMDAINALPEER